MKQSVTMSDTGKKKIWLIPATVLLATVLSGAFMVYQGVQAKRATQEAKALRYQEEAWTETNAETLPPGTVVWNGKYYTYNENLSNFLFLGVDRRELADTSVGLTNAGQTDAVFLLSWDRVERNMTVIAVPRDTMTSYTACGPDGSRNTIRDHLSFAYVYGDGKHESCRLTSEAVSGLFYGIPIQGYCAVSMNAMPVIIDAVEGLKVTVPNESLESRYPEYIEGTTITLDRENIEPYLRYRDTSVSQTALLRLERQEVFLEAYADKMMQQFCEDPGFIPDMYEELEPCMVTNIGVDQFARIAECVLEGKRIEHWTVPGEGATGADGYDEYHADDDALYEKVIETFYREISGTEQ